MNQHYDSTASFIKERIAPHQPEIALVLGSGLGGFADQLENPIIIPYAEIPHWLQPTVHGHQGKLVLGQIEGKWILVQQGRSHFYEGHSAQEITFPIRVMHYLGIRTIILTNAAGGVNPSYSAGEIMVLNDHLYFAGLAGHNPLIGTNDDSMGPRFVGMAQTYDKAYRLLTQEVAQEHNLPVHHGVYACVAGPMFESPAEIRALRMLGADAVGMSTVHEVVVARHVGMRVLAISSITNVAIDSVDTTLETNHAEVLEIGAKIVPRLITLLRGVIRKM